MTFFISVEKFICLGGINIKKKSFIVLIGLSIVIVVFYLSFYKVYFIGGEMHTERRLFHNSNYSEESIENSNLIVMISNQSFENEKVRIEGYIDGERLFKGKFRVGDQHLVTYYYKELEVGEYDLKIESEDGAILSETILIDEEKLWVFVSYWYSNSIPKLHINKQNEPIYID